MLGPSSGVMFFESGELGERLPSWCEPVAGVFAVTAVILSLISMLSHLKHYRKPHLQRFVIRIIRMVPIYAIASWISLKSTSLAFYLDAIRDIYEAFVIYCFFNLLVNYLGGERSLLTLLHDRPPTPHVAPVSFFIKEINIGDPFSFLFIKRGILQYVYVKPFLALLTMLLKYLDTYSDGYIAVESGYFWISMVYNISCSLTLYCLALFYMCTKDDLAPYRPIPKFLCVKAVIFFSFWQGFAISVLVYAGVIPGDEEYSGNFSAALQDFFICIEMFFAAIAHWYAFSYKDYYDQNVQSARMPIKYAVRDAGGMRDVYEDTMETFRGSRFNYRTFEPAEGMAHIGASRTARIMAGLRYASGGARKYWVSEPNQKAGLLSGKKDEDSYSLNFPDELDSDVESMYEHSKKLGKHGDYNFPVIDANYIRPGSSSRYAKPGSSSRSGKSKRRETISKKRYSSSSIAVEEEEDEEEDDVRPELKKSRQLSDVVPPFRPGCVDLVKEVKDESGRRLESYVNKIEKITASSHPTRTQSYNATPTLGPIISLGLPYSLPTHPYPTNSTSRYNGRSSGSDTNGSTSYSMTTVTRPLEINGSSRHQERADTTDDQGDPLGVIYSGRSLEKNMWKDNVWE